MTHYTLKTALLNASKEDLEALSSKWVGERDLAAHNIAEAQMKALQEEASAKPRGAWVFPLCHARQD